MLLLMKDEIKQVIDIFFADLAARLSENNISVDLTEAAKDLMIKEALTRYTVQGH